MKNDYFLTEIDKYKRLYFRTIYCFTEFSKNIKNKFKDDFSKYEESPIIYDDGFLPECIIVDNNIRSMCIHLSHIDKIIIGQMVLIRVVSALEKSLISLLGNIFNINKQYFYTQNDYIIKESELLSLENINTLHNNILEKIQRNLHNQGFKEICRYYKKIFNVDLHSFNCKIDSKLYNIVNIEQYHDLRHLLVHKLGEIDKQYKQSYGYRFLFTPYNMSTMFLVFEKFYVFYLKQTENLFLPQKLIKVEEEISYTCNIEITIINDEAKSIFSNYFSFKFKDNLIRAKDICSNFFISDNKISLKLNSNRRYVSKYIGFIKKEERKGNLIIDKLYFINKQQRIPLSKEKFFTYENDNDNDNDNEYSLLEE